MIKQDERIDMVMEVLQRIAPELYERYSRPTQDNLIPQKDIESHPLLPTAPSITPAELKTLLQRIGPLPPYSALMGQCSDGLPFLFDLSDPQPGSVLILGDALSGKSKLLLTILSSAAALNPPNRVAINVISANPGEFDLVASLPHTENLISTYDRASSELIIELAAIAEQRKSGRERGPITLLAVDDLAGLLSYNEYEVNSHLRWLLRNGPRLGIWPVVTLDPCLLHQVDNKILDEFGTRLLGHASKERISDRIFSGRVPQLNTGNFIALLGSEQVNFWVPNM